MKNIIFCCALLCTSAVLANDAGTVAKIDAGTVAKIDAGTAAKIDAGVALVEMPALLVTGAVEPVAVDAGTAVVVVDPTFTDPFLSARGFYHAVTTGNGWLIAMFILFFLVGSIRVVGKRVHAMIPDDTKHVILRPVEKVLYFIFDTKVGGWVLNWLSAIGGCVSTAAMAGHPVDGDTWKVAILASTGGTALIELKDDVMEWWDKRTAAAAEKKLAEEAAKLSVVAPSPEVPAAAPAEPAALVAAAEPASPAEPVKAPKAKKAPKLPKA